ncbi:MAG: FAD-dependent oxidoreductase [Anaerolineae bacterium]
MKSSDRVIECDVLVIGGGIAGCMAAIKAQEAGAKVILADKGFVSRTGQSPYVDSHLVFNEAWGDDLQAWLESMAEIGEYVNNPVWTKMGLEESYERFQEFTEWGVDWKKNPDGEYYRRLSNKGVTKTIFMGPIQIPTLLRDKVKERKIRILDRTMIAELLKQDGRLVGAVGFSWKTYKLTIFKAKSVIMATGASGLKPPSWPIHNLTGDGDAMAYRVGAEILGKEYTDPHPTSAMDPANFNFNFKFGGKTNDELGPPKGKIFNAEGDEIPRRGTLFPDMEFEVHAGRGPFMFHPDRADLEPREMIGGGAAGMAVHKTEGIWPADTDCSTGVPGLFAAGDSLGTMASGAAYAAMGLSSAHCSVTGARAGTAAAKYAQQVELPSIDAAMLEETKKQILAPTERKGGFTPQWVIQNLQNIMMPYYVMFIKKGDRLEAALTMVEFVRDHLVPKMYVTDTHGLRLAHEARNMALISEMRLRSSLFRTESRGCHFREDYPYRDDANWLAWTLMKEEDGRMKLYKEPIPQEHWPDFNIPYEQRYEWRFPGEEEHLPMLNKMDSELREMVAKA